jgi:hypothetical protein
MTLRAFAFEELMSRYALFCLGRALIITGHKDGEGQDQRHYGQAKACISSHVYIPLSVDWTQVMSQVSDDVLDLTFRCELAVFLFSGTRNLPTRADHSAIVQMDSYCFAERVLRLWRHSVQNPSSSESIDSTLTG